MNLRVVIIGAAGQLGSALVAELQNGGWTVVALARRDLDVTHAGAAADLVALRPDVIINASAWNDVDGAEDDPGAAMVVNRDGVARLASAAAAAGAVFVHYSTDFVFDGRATAPYVEDAVRSPLGAYGRSKAAGEDAALQTPRAYVLRLSSVFGGRPGEGAGGRSTIDRITTALAEGREVRAFSDRTVSPSYTADVAAATRQLIAGQAPYGIYHCVSTGFTTWSALAGEVSRRLGIAGHIVETRSAAVPMRAERPQFCALSNAKLAAAGIVMPSWQDALARHLTQRLASS
jgi:dTDP-4-dehydrorhamnose reductase